MNQKNQSVLVVGAGDAIGSAIVRKFAREGYQVVGVRRNGEKLDPLVEEMAEEGHTVHGWSCDARKEEAIIDLFERIETEVAPLEVVIFNIGANVPLDILETTTRKFYKIWEMACFSGFLTGREAAKYMLERGKGTIIFTGATASVRGASGYAAFAMAKHGLRAVAQSMARELGPKNIHVAHLIIDAAVDTPWIREAILPTMENRQPDDIVEPDSIAQNYLNIHKQSRDAWTFELDLRPYCEKW